MPSSSSCQVRSKQLSVNTSSRPTTDSVEEVMSRKVLELRQDLAQGIKKPFKDIVDATSGDSSSCGQKPISFIRQVSALCCLPELLEDDSFPDDVKSRARLFLQNHARDNTGIEMVRRHVATFLQLRDNCPADYNDVILVPGLSATVKTIKKILHVNAAVGSVIGLMSPVPQFLPLSTLFIEHGIQLVPYPLDEVRGWSIDKVELDKSLSQGRTFCNPRALLVVNPGHPTGNFRSIDGGARFRVEVKEYLAHGTDGWWHNGLAEGHILSKSNIEEIITFAEREKLLIIACEIYQGAVHDEYDFLSFKKVMFEMSSPANNTELVSFLLYSGDFTKEPGQQNGFIEFFNIEEQVKTYIKESILTSDSSPFCSQVALDCIVNPPKPWEPSYPLFCRDTGTFPTYTGVLAKTVHNYITRIPGFSCSSIHAGYCAFIKIDLPPKAVNFANLIDLCPSTFYVVEMLQNCGVATAPGKQYGQNPGSYHFMMSFLMPEDKLMRILVRIREFQIMFMNQYQQ